MGLQKNWSLTPRQIELGKLFASGYTSQEVADKIGISPNTVNTHRTELYDRLKVHNTAQMVKALIIRGYLKIEEFLRMP